jgi:hypothetical protein
MRRSVAVFRGAKSFGWYDQYKKNPEHFGLYTKLTPFNWEEGKIKRPIATFELESNGEDLGSLEFELAHDILPKTVTNFINLIKGNNGRKLTYQNTKIHLVRKGEVVMGGDVEGGNGKYSHSSFEDRFFFDENFIIPHTSRGLLRFFLFFFFSVHFLSF